MFVPPNGDNATRDPALIVTAVQDGTVVDIVDDAADGDDDDSALGLTLNTGQSYIIYIQEGAINDDLGGKADGDYFLIQATKPVVVANLTVNTDWQHDFLPADNRRMSGTSFYLYRPLGFSQTDSRNELLNIFSYNDNTDIQIFDITATPKTSSGLTTVVPRGDADLIFSTTLAAGEDLQEVHDLTVSLPAGHTFHIVSNKDVTVQFGALSKGASGSRDGGSYVPGKGGTSADRTFYFAIPYRYANERELRLVSYDKPADVTIRGWNTQTDTWATVATVALPKYGHEELVGTAELGADYYLFEVTANETISIFETNWLETGSFGTSDIVTFISAQDGSGAGQSFLAYMGPPALELGVQLSHLYVYAYQAVSGVAYDADSYGEYIELLNNGSQTITLTNWYLQNEDGWRITFPAGASIPPGDSYLLEFHERATNSPADFVYGSLYPKFKLGNGADTVTLHNPAGAAVDSVSYDDSWGNHGVYHALERINPALPFTSSNARSSTQYVSQSASNLGDYYGTPGLAHTPPTGEGSLVINELMTGRIYDSFSIPANGYYDVALTVAEWKGIHNGTNPASTNTPENPYLIVETDAPVSVMNANWNDNWLAYGTGTVQPDPHVNHTADYYQREADRQATFTTYASNEYNTLLNPVTTITLPPEFDYTPGSYQTPDELPGILPTETQQADGSWTLTWVHGTSMPAGATLRFQVTATIKASVPANTLLQSVALVTGLDLFGASYASQDSAVITVGDPGTDEPTTTADIVINELLPNPLCGNEWIEIHNRSTNDINIGGWELADEDGFIFQFPELTFIPNDGYIVVYLGDGVATESAFFTGAAFASALADEEDQVALYSAGEHTTATLVDFVQWDNDGTLAEPGDDDLAVAAGKWPAGGRVIAPAAGQSMGRDRSATNGFTPADWDNTGGPDSDGVTTPEAINVSIPGADTTPPGAVSQATVTAIVGSEGTLRLNWQNPPDGDFAGVSILRATDTYPQSLNDGLELFNGVATEYIDTGVAPGESLFYTLLTYDDAGNVSCPVPAGQVRAIAPQRIHIVYEDLKGTGWVDWDTNDLVIVQDAVVQLSDAGVTQIQANFALAARGSSYDHSFYFTAEFAGLADTVVRRYDADGLLSGTESYLHRDGADILIFDHTRTLLPPTHPGGTANAVNGTPQVDGPTVAVTITFREPALNPPEFAQLPPFDPWIQVHNTGQNIHLMEAGYISDSQRVWDANSPLVGRDIPLALSFNQAWAWPAETHPIWDAYPQYPAFVTSGATLNETWYQHPDPDHLWQPGTFGNIFAALGHNVNQRLASLSGQQLNWPQATDGLLFASPLIADLNGDGQAELIAASQDGYVHVWQADGSTLAGWPKYAFGTVRSSPAAGDIDGDGDLELLIGSDNGRLYAWQHNGSYVAGFPANLGGAIKASPALANLDADEALEIVVHSTSADLFVLDNDGTIWPNWPQQMNGVDERYGNFIVGSTPAVGDMNGDDIPEIVVGSTDGRLYAYQLDGSLLSPFWPLATRDWIYASPVIVDLNQDGFRDVVVTSGDGRLYVWRGDGVPLPGFPLRIRGSIMSSPAVVDLDGDGRLEIIFGTTRGQVWAVHEDGTPVAGWPREIGAIIQSSPVVGDLDGDGDQEVVIGAHDGGLYGWHHDGIPMAGWPKQTTDWIVATPTLGDLDGDGDIELAAAAYDKQVYVWDLAGSYEAAHVSWPTFHGSADRAGLVATSVPIQPLPETFTIFLPISTRD